MCLKSKHQSQARLIRKRRRIKPKFKREEEENIFRGRDKKHGMRDQLTIPKLRASDQAIVENQLKRIANENINIICLDIEMYVKNPESSFSQCKNVCLWVAIIQSNETLLYESFAKPEKTEITKIGTRFHGLD